MAFDLPKLKYPYDALEPIIDEETMKIHHTRHHQAYINKLENTLKNVEQPLEDINYYIYNWRKIKNVKYRVKTDIINFSGGHFNHAFFWNVMCPQGKSEPICNELTVYINKAFGSFDKMVETFNSAAESLFGSGWVWLCYDMIDDTLAIRKTPNQDCIVTRATRFVPILNLDVWEHAYYLKYKNDRSTYIKNWWKIVDWGCVSKIFVKLALNKKPLRINPDGSIEGINN